MNKARPVNLNLLTIKQPLPAIVSILHRITGVVLLLSMPYLLWLLSGAIRSPERFITSAECLAHPFGKFLFFAAFAAFSFHMIAGLRHLLMDCGVGESLKGGRMGAYLVLLLTLIVVIYGGMKIW